MKKKPTDHLHRLMRSENEQLAKLHKIVHDTLEEESLISERVQQENDNRTLSFGERVADKVAEFGGSWTFIILFAGILLVWIVLNTFVLTQHPFDPYPYILLNLVLSTIAALQAPVIMMSQNRQAAKDRRNAINDYLVNLKAEIEVRRLHEKIDLLMEEQFLNLFKIQEQQMKLLQELQVEVKKSKG